MLMLFQKCHEKNETPGIIGIINWKFEYQKFTNYHQITITKCDPN